MRVSDILKVKGSALFTVTPDTPITDAIDSMASHDIGSLVVMEYGELAGMLTFREIILVLHANGGSVGTTTMVLHSGVIPAEKSSRGSKRGEASSPEIQLITATASWLAQSSRMGANQISR